ncbi:type II secretion system protein GspL [Sphingosinicella sp. BN140058]|uniref:type II secretion system protein GspL n=1 Tax=Sphingosinicella sp. BN140058 TaxID=1892855 RepID=UPI0013ED711B|nr:type II secretion system protein GspL [Sphingosinicella sp. BN140058]
MRLAPRLIAFLQGDAVVRWATTDETGRFAAVERPDDARDCVAVVPGDRIALHWVDLPQGLAPAQAAAAARLMVADLSAEPIGGMHLALGATTQNGSTCVALVSPSAMDAWLAVLTQEGLDPGLIVPETALLMPASESLVRLDRSGMALCRGPAEAFALETPLADLVLGDRPVLPLSDQAWTAGIAAALATPLVNLRQGSFGRQRLSVQASLVRRAAWLLFAILVVTIAAQLVAAYRDSAAAGRMEEEARTIAAQALPRGRGIVDPAAQLKERLSELGGGPGAFSAESAVVFAAVRDTPMASLTGLSYQAGVLSIGVKADSPATLAALRTRIEATGYAVAGPPPSAAEGESRSQWLVKPQ